MVMKKIKPQYGKVIPPVVGVKETDEVETETSEVMEAAISGSDVSVENIDITMEAGSNAEAEKSGSSASNSNPSQRSPTKAKEQAVSHLLSEPNPFLQTRETLLRR